MSKDIHREEETLSPSTVAQAMKGGGGMKKKSKGVKQGWNAHKKKQHARLAMGLGSARAPRVAKASDVTGEGGDEEDEDDQIRDGDPDDVWNQYQRELDNEADYLRQESERDKKKTGTSAEFKEAYDNSVMTKDKAKQLFEEEDERERRKEERRAARAAERAAREVEIEDKIAEKHAPKPRTMEERIAERKARRKAEAKGKPIRTARVDVRGKVDGTTRSHMTAKERERAKAAFGKKAKTEDDGQENDAWASHFSKPDNAVTRADPDTRRRARSEQVTKTKVVKKKVSKKTGDSDRKFFAEATDEEWANKWGKYATERGPASMKSHMTPEERERARKAFGNQSAQTTDDLKDDAWQRHFSKKENADKLKKPQLNNAATDAPMTDRQKERERKRLERQKAREQREKKLGISSPGLADVASAPVRPRKKKGGKYDAVADASDDAWNKFFTENPVERTGVKDDKDLLTAEEKLRAKQAFGKDQDF